MTVYLVKLGMLILPRAFGVKSIEKLAPLTFTIDYISFKPRNGVHYSVSRQEMP